MTRTEKALTIGLGAGFVAVCGFAAFYGVTVQRRNAARAKIVRPEVMELYDALQNEAAARQSAEAPGTAAAAPPRDEIERGRQSIARYEYLLEQAESVGYEGELAEVMNWIDKPLALWPEGMRARLADLLAEIQPLLDAVRNAAAHGGPVVALDLSKGNMLDLSHLARVRHLARLLKADAIAAADAGDIDRMLDNITGMIDLGDAIAAEPVLVSQLVRFAIAGNAYSALGQLIPQGALTDAQSQRLMHLLGEAHRREEFAASFSGEAVFAEMIFEDPATAMDGHYPSERSRRMEEMLLTIYTGPIGSPLSNVDEAIMLDTLARFQELARLPYYQAQPELDQLAGELDDLSVVRIFSRNMLPALVQVFEAQARNDAMLDLAQIGMAVESFQQDFGAYPGSLNEVADRIPGGVPVDPFTGQPYVYRPSGGSVLLYSLGANRLDDGGRYDLRDGDIVWRAAIEEPGQKSLHVAMRE